VSESDLSVSTIRSRHIFGVHIPRRKIRTPVIFSSLQSESNKIYYKNENIIATKRSLFI
jgi:hypothetical protein